MNPLWAKNRPYSRTMSVNTPPAAVTRPDSFSRKGLNLRSEDRTRRTVRTVKYAVATPSPIVIRNGTATYNPRNTTTVAANISAIRISSGQEKSNLSARRPVFSNDAIGAGFEKPNPSAWFGQLATQSRSFKQFASTTLPYSAISSWTRM